MSVKIKDAGTGLAQAVDQALKAAIDKKNRGGLIALDKDDPVKFGFNTKGIYRGYVKGDGKPVVQIYRD